MNTVFEYTLKSYDSSRAVQKMIVCAKTKKQAMQKLFFDQDIDPSEVSGLKEKPNQHPWNTGEHKWS